MGNFKYTIFLYFFVLLTFIKSLKPLIAAPNYTLSFKSRILLLEIFFLLKTVYSIIFNKKIKKESFLGYKIVFPSYLDFFCLFAEMFGIQEYRFISTKKTPSIIDGGSNWGMSVIYFKHFYPNSRIIAIEANKNTIDYLKKNMKLNNFSGIVIYNAVLAKKKGMHDFFINNRSDKWSLSDTGAIDTIGTRSDFSKIKVKSLQLSKFLAVKTDVLKLDVEGMEGEVLDEAKKRLHNVCEIIMEYHGGNGGLKNQFNKIDKILKNSSFVYSGSGGKSLLPRKKENSLRIIHAINKYSI